MDIFAPESVVHFTPELIVHYSPEYSLFSDRLLKWSKKNGICNNRIIDLHYQLVFNQNFKTAGSA